jgi:hypothetical protein
MKKNDLVHDELVALFKEYEIADRHLYSIDQLVIPMQQINPYKFADVIEELVHDRRIPDRSRTRGPLSVLNYINKLDFNTFLDYILASINRIRAKIQ